MRPIFLKPGANLEDFVVMNGFTHHETNDTRVNYFTNKKGNQIKIDYQFQEIKFIDKNGDTKDVAKTFTESEILAFAEGE